MTPRVIVWSVLLVGALFVEGVVYTTLEWNALNGRHWQGTCPGGPPDIGPYACTWADLVARNLFSPFAAMSWLLVLMSQGLIVCVVWAIWTATQVRPLSWLAVARAAAPVVAAWLLSPLLWFVLVFASIRTLQASPSRPGPTIEHITPAEYARAWALPIRLVERTRDEPSVALPRGAQDVLHASLEATSGDVRSVLTKWPARCWQAQSALPAWLSKVRFLITARSETAILVGLRVRGPNTAQPAEWAKSFEEAERLFLAGGVVEQWFAIEVHEREYLDGFALRQRGYADDMRSWRPICQSDGELVRAFLERPVLHGALRGRVDSDRFPVAGARMSFEHEDGRTHYQAETSADGCYQVTLAQGRYHVRIVHPDHAAYDPARGWVVITPGSDSYARFKLE